MDNVSCDKQDTFASAICNIWGVDWRSVHTLGRMDTSRVSMRV